MKKRHYPVIGKLMALVLAITLVLPVSSMADMTGIADDGIVYGDVNNDDGINAKDALMALKHAAKLIELTETEFVCADVDGNTDVTAKDALYILQYAAGIIDRFPIDDKLPEATETPEATVVPTVNPTEQPTEEPTTIPTETIPFSGTIYIAGDSIADGVPDNENPSNIPQAGWGDYLNANYDADKVYVDNQAKRGESCLSFFYDYNGDGIGDSKVYKAIYDNIKADDYVIISFGHNDQNPAANRYASPTAPTSERGSFKWWLKEKFIEPARAVGATPILMTPVVRCTYDSNGKFTETATHLLYGQAMRELVAEYAAEGITIYLIDAQQYTYDLYGSLTYEQAKEYHAYWSDSLLDDTHYNEKGANMMADYVSGELAKFPLGINQYLK